MTLLEREALQEAIRNREDVDLILHHVADRLMATAKWPHMTHSERTVCVRRIINQVHTKAEFEQALRVIGCFDHVVGWRDVDPNEEQVVEARMLAQALGMLISKTGAMVTLMTAEEMF